ncbi:MAG TPA: hypothetical protein PK335_12495 [Draconibacterium sp.]|nr:hypothetical protein [Draconibacterium sp.]
MRTLQILLLLLFIRIPLLASDNYPVGARSIALSNAFVSVSDSWSTFHNQATLAKINQFSAGVFYESRFTIDELSLAAGTFVFPFARGTAGLSFYQFGKATFKESKIGLAYSKQLSEKLSAGIQMDYFLNRFPENEKAFGFTTFELGVTYQLTDEFTLGAHVFNPVENGITTYYGKEKMPLILRIGGHYEFSERAILSTEYYINSNEKDQVRTGLEFYILKNLVARMGVSGTPVKYTAGLGYHFGKISTDLAFSYHGDLGFSPCVSIQFQL